MIMSSVNKDSVTYFLPNFMPGIFVFLSYFTVEDLQFNIE